MRGGGAAALLAFNALCVVAAVDRMHDRIERRLRAASPASDATADDATAGAPHASVRDAGRRAPPAGGPSQRQLNLKIVDMLRQSIYVTQHRVGELQPTLERYKDDVSFRMRFLFNRLEQLLVDMRRVFTLATRWRRTRRVLEQITWYTHCFRKFVDVLYSVEHARSTHAELASKLGPELGAEPPAPGHERA